MAEEIKKDGPETVLGPGSTADQIEEVIESDPAANNAVLKGVDLGEALKASLQESIDQLSVFAKDKTKTIVAEHLPSMMQLANEAAQGNQWSAEGLVEIKALIVMEICQASQVTDAAIRASVKTFLDTFVAVSTRMLIASAAGI